MFKHSLMSLFMRKLHRKHAHRIQLNTFLAELKDLF